MWDRSKLVAYEVQTNAVRGEIERCIEKQKNGRYKLIFITNSMSTRKEIRAITGNAYETRVIKPYKVD